ncbi:MAG: aminotransferase class I/II-fold pyridoxal phosphate-dependent enzyme [archaeon]
MTELKLTEGARKFFSNPSPSYVSRHVAAEELLDLSLGVLDPENPVSRYNDPSLTRLKEAISGVFQIIPDQVCLGAGIDTMLESIPQLFEGGIIITDPDFPRFAEVGIRYDRKIHTMQRNSASGFAFDDPIIGKILQNMESDQKIVMLSTPNNPTGQLIPLDYLHKLSERADQGHLLALDLAYGEFAGLSYVQEVVNIASNSRNTIALLTFSKARGIAGIARVGYGISNPSISDAIEKWRLPFIVSGEAEAIGSITNGNLDAIISEVDEKRIFIEQIVAANPSVDMIYNGKTNTILVKGIDFDVSDYLLSIGIKTSPHPWIHDIDGTSLGYTRVTLGNWDAVNCLGDALQQL